jgi:thiamine pyrophosphate-dependent acetolactate synthase large subunit-like protein
MTDATQITGGELLARCLVAEDVRFVFGLPCPEVDPFLAALDAHGIRFVPVRHEAAGVHMAEGLYKTSGRVAAVFGNPGPGSANLLPGVITARHEGVPVLVVTAQHRLGIVYPSPPSTFQGQDQLDVFRPAVKWNAPIFAWERIPSALGCRLAAPDRHVVCVSGDGAAGFNVMEMQSAAREGLKITTIVFAEGSWSMEEPNERLFWGKTFGTAMGEVRWDKVAEGLGCKGWYADRIEDVGAAVAAAKACEGPAVVCLRTSRDANLMLPQDMVARFFEVYQGVLA